MAFSSRKLFAALITLGVMLTGAGAPSANSQSTGATQIPDPTPRERDLRDRYSDSPALQEQQNRIAAARRAQLRVQATAHTNEILLLAQQLRSHRVHPEERAYGPSDQLVAQKIESLAKRVKDDLQSR